MLTEMTIDPGNRVQVRYVIPSAICCFFHVYEEHVGTYGFSVLKHVLVYPEMKTGCDRDLDRYEYVAVSNDIVVDRTWCKACAATVDEESQRGHSPTRRDGEV
jgi:hypothetical protein